MSGEQLGDDGISLGKHDGSPVEVKETIGEECADAAIDNWHEQ